MRGRGRFWLASCHRRWDIRPSSRKDSSELKERQQGTFFIILNLKFLDQLKRRHCKDTPYFRPFYIGAPKGPFL
jgi:hypothetical protein